MVKLSDALRGAADKAPLDGLTIDGAHAARRVSRSRGLRAGANGLLGAGAVALVAVAVIGPGSALPSRIDDSARDTSESTVSGGMDAVAPGAAGESSLAWGLCGSTLPAMPEIALPVSLTATLPTGEAVDGTLGVTATVSTVEDGTFGTFGVDGVVLWDGIVVATIDGDPAAAPVREAQEVSLTAGSDTVTDLTVPLENCWDGAALPAGKYELVLTQELWSTAPVPEEPPVDPGTVEPPVDPGTVEPSVAGGPDDAVSSDDAASSSAATGDEGAAGAGSTIAADASMRVIAAPVGFTVPGDAVDQPFAAYLGTEPVIEPTLVDPGPVDPAPLSDSALNAATARDLYLAGLTGAWDMAPGSQRWLATADGMGAIESTWWGCGYEGDARFPSESAELDLLAVDASTPSSIDVSYGWIVEGNPEVTMNVTNTSQWDLTQFWGLQSVSLALVRGGLVVAEAYPVNPVQNQIAYATDAAITSSDSAAMSIAPDAWGGFLGAGETAGGTYLWRDVNTCWTESGQRPLEPGTYTLLAMHQLSVPGSSVGVEPSVREGAEPSVREGAEPSVREGAADSGQGDATGIVVPEPGTGWATAGEDIAIAPMPGADDWFELQVWTSLGSVSVG